MFSRAGIGRRRADGRRPLPGLRRQRQYAAASSSSDSGDATLGTVCVVPIGITEISSVQINVDAGDQLAKGDELGVFSYGGSSMALVFQPGAIANFTVDGPKPGGNPDDGPRIKASTQIAVAK